MRILLVSSIAKTSKTGVTAHYNRMLAQLADRGESVELITPADTPVALKKVLGVFRRAAALFGQNGRVLFLELENFVSVWAAVRRKGADAFDIIHAQDVTAGAAATLANRSKTARVVVTCHFNDDPPSEYRQEYTISSWTNRRLTNWFQFLFRQPHAFTTVSDYTKQKSAWLRPEQTPCTVIHNGVMFPPVVSSEDNGPLIIANIGTIEARKNQLLLIEAAAELRDRGGRQFQVWLLGDGVKRTEWQASVRERKLEDFVSFLGFQRNVMDILPTVSLYVHTARNESWGYTITEAIAAGTPVLALATGGIPEQFAAHKPGLLPADTTPGELADAVLRYQDYDDQRQLANQQRQYAYDRFRLDIMIDNYLACYRSLLNQQDTGYTQKYEQVVMPGF